MYLTTVYCTVEIPLAVPFIQHRYFCTDYLYNSYNVRIRYSGINAYVTQPVMYIVTVRVHVGSVAVWYQLTVLSHKSDLSD